MSSKKGKGRIIVLIDTQNPYLVQCVLLIVTYSRLQGWLCMCMRIYLSAGGSPIFTFWLFGS